MAALRNKALAGLDIKAVIGSGFLWAWFDALFMSAFFVPSGQQGFFSEVATIATFFLGLPVFLLAMCRNQVMCRFLSHRKTLVLTGLAGTVGSLLLFGSGFVGSWFILIVGAILAALFMACACLAWGAVYSSHGANSAMRYVAGGFAFAFVIDVPLLLMVPVGAACFFALLPLASMLMLVVVDPKLRIYPQNAIVSSPETSVSTGRLRRYFGVSLPALGAVMIIMAGFGYVQHLASFSATNVLIGSGVLIQMVRGVVAVCAFVFVLVVPKRASWMYRVGLLAMVAGFSLMPFLYTGSSFEISGAIIIGGYTIFDVLSWVIFSQVAHTRSDTPLRTIAVMRLAVGACYAVGAVAGIVLSATSLTSSHVFEEAIFVGYLMTVAIVLLLTSKEVWELFAPESVEHVQTGRGRAQGLTDQGSVAESMTASLPCEGTAREISVTSGFPACAAWGLTQREQEIVSLLVVGRTQPWIAESLSISENTVNTHVRRIYQKMDVHNRQELIDLVLDNSSHESGDELSACN